MPEYSNEDRQGLIKDLTLMLMYLTSWEEKSAGKPVRRTWKSYDWDAVDALQNEGLISTSNRAKSAYLSEEACQQAHYLATCFSAMQDTILDSVRAALEERTNHPGAFKLRVGLDLWDEHPCWRELVVPAWFTFADLHQAIQASFLWWNYHMYDFKLHTKGKDLMLIDPQQGGVDAMFAFPPGKRTTVDSASLHLDEVFPRTRTARYSYDYGDGWEHTITLVETFKEYDGLAPVCEAGEGDAPPEDVGSVPGFERFLKEISDKSHPNHAEAVEWGYSQFYEPFSLKAVNERIEKWNTQELFDEWDERHAR